MLLYCAINFELTFNSIYKKLVFFNTIKRETKIGIFYQLFSDKILTLKVPSRKIGILIICVSIPIGFFWGDFKRSFKEK